MSDKQLPPPIPGQLLDEIEVPGITMIHGVTLDGTNVWFAGAPDNDLHCVDPRSGKLLRRLGRKDCAAGTAWDGKHLWQICGDRIHQIDPKTGSTVRSIPAPDAEDCSGLAWAAGHLWVGSYRGRKIHKVDPETGRVVATLTSDRLVTGVTWAGTELWHGTYPEREEDVGPGELRQVDPQTGAVKRRVHLPAGTRISGTEWNGKDRFWFGSRAKKDTLRSVKKP